MTGQPGGEGTPAARGCGGRRRSIGQCREQLRVGRARVLVAACCACGLLAAGSGSRIAPAPPALDAVHVIGPDHREARRVGEAVASDGDLLAVCAPTDGDDALQPGLVSIHRMTLGSEGALRVQLEQTLSAQRPTRGDHFGASVAVLGACRSATPFDILAIGADRGDSGASSEGAMAGAVEIFERSETNPPVWRGVQRLGSSSPEPGASFGAAVAFDRAPNARSARLAIGSPRHDAVGAFDAGRAHIFERAAPPVAIGGRAHWAEVASITPPEPKMSMWFGAAVALDGDYLAIGSPGDEVANRSNGTPVPAAGAVYLYRRVAAGVTDARDRYRLERVLTAPTPEPAAWFGLALELDHGLLAVGAPRARNESSGNQPIGCVYLFDLSEPAMAPKRVDPPLTAATYGFGQALALRGGQLAIGAPSTDAFESEVRGGLLEDAGAAWVYSLALGDFVATLIPPKPRTTGLFGSSCALGEAIAPAPSTHRPARQRAVAAIVGHRFVEEESIAPSPGAAIFTMPQPPDEIVAESTGAGPP